MIDEYEIVSEFGHLILFVKEHLDDFLEHIDFRDRVGRTEALIDECSAAPKGIFGRCTELDIEYYFLITQCPGLFVRLLKRFPGECENMFGYVYFLSPIVLKSAIESGERISSELLDEEYRESTARLKITPIHFVLRHLVDFEVFYSGKKGEWMEWRNCIEAASESLRLLVGAGVNINLRDRGGGTVFDEIICEDSSEYLMLAMIPLLFQLGASPDVSELTAGCTALHVVLDQFGPSGYVTMAVLKAVLDCPFPLDMVRPSHQGFTPLDSCWSNPELTAEALALFLNRMERPAERVSWKESSRSFAPGREFKPPLIYLMARRGLPNFEPLCDVLLMHGFSLEVPLLSAGRTSYFETNYFHYGKAVEPVRGPRLCDVVVENKDGLFSVEVVDYFRRRIH